MIWANMSICSTISQPTSQAYAMLCKDWSSVTWAQRTLFGYAVPDQRRPEVDTYYIKEMLARAPAELQPVGRVTLEKQRLWAGP